MSITAIIPAYNAAMLLPTSIGSVLAQTAPVAEIIVVDDGSTDSTAEVAAEYPVRVIRQENRGPAGTRNAGVRAAQTEWVAFLDADDRWYPNKIERMAGAIGEHPEASVFYSDAIVLDPSGAELGNFLADKGPATGWIFDRLLCSMFVLPSTVLARRDALIETGLFSEHLRGVEDYDLWLRMAPKYQFHLVPEALTGYCRQELSLSRNTERMRRDEISVLQPLLETPLTREQKASVRRRLASNMFDLSYVRRAQDPREALHYAWRSLRMNPRRLLTWKLLAVSVARCLQGAAPAPKAL